MGIPNADGGDATVQDESQTLEVAPAEIVHACSPDLIPTLRTIGLVYQARNDNFEFPMLAPKDDAYRILLGQMGFEKIGGDYDSLHFRYFDGTIINGRADAEIPKNYFNIATENKDRIAGHLAECKRDKSPSNAIIVIEGYCGNLYVQGRGIES